MSLIIEKELWNKIIKAQRLTSLEKEMLNEQNKHIKGEKNLFVINIGRLPHNKSYFCIRETASGYYVQSFDTTVLYVSKKTGRLLNVWGGYSRATMVHINKGLDWIRENTDTVPQLKRLSGGRYFSLPLYAGMGKMFKVA